MVRPLKLTGVIVGNFERKLGKVLEPILWVWFTLIFVPMRYQLFLKSAFSSQHIFLA